MRDDGSGNNVRKYRKTYIAITEEAPMLFVLSISIFKIGGELRIIDFAKIALSFYFFCVNIGSSIDTDT